jgi:hypothetical protein
MANESFEKLAEKIGAPGYPRYIKILENQMTAEEAQMAVEVSDGMTPEQLAKTHNMDEKSAAAKIEDLVTRRILLKGKGGYTIPRTPRFFPQGPRNEKTLQLRTDFFRSGDYQKILVDGWK